VELPGRLLAIGVKWTERPTRSDARHLRTFLAENRAAEGFVVCRCRRPLDLGERITAVAWDMI
jgi:hypothetical protein